MSAIIFCFCSFISWQRSIILASVMFFPSAGPADRAWTGDQRARATANARLERITRFVFVWFFSLYFFFFVFVRCGGPADSVFEKSVSPRSARVPTLRLCRRGGGLR